VQSYGTLRNGGGIGNDGKLTLTDTVSADNAADAFLGGGTYNSNNGPIALINRVVRGNLPSGVTKRAGWSQTFDCLVILVTRLCFTLAKIGT
jgi:hypothetical protein